jgi:hypothetical protein
MRYDTTRDFVQAIESASNAARKFEQLATHGELPSAELTSMRQMAHRLNEIAEYYRDTLNALRNYGT